MNRRTFLQTSLVAAAGLATRRLLTAQTAAAPAAFTPLRRNVGYFTGRGGTIGWLASPEALAVVDTQFPDTALKCLEGLPGRVGRLLDVVINTHHHMDHTAGNGVFKPASKLLVAQANVPRLQLEAAQRAAQGQHPDPAASVERQVFADTTFQDVWRHDLGSERITAEFRGPAHTGGDTVILFEKANVIHMGDLMFNRLYPVIDRPGGASIAGWIKALEDCAKAYPADAIYVFGHGSAKFGVSGARSDLLVLRDYLSALLDHVSKQLKAGRQKSEIVALENFPGFPDFHSPLPNRLGSNLGAAYDELTNAKA